MGGNFTNYAVYNGTSLLDLATFGNSVTGGLFWAIVLFLFYGILFISLSKIRPFKDAFAVSSYITGIFAMFLWAATLISSSIMIIFILLMVVSIIMIMMRSDTEI